MRKFAALLIVLAVALSLGLFFGRAKLPPKKAAEKPSKAKIKATAHVVSREQRQKIIDDTKKAIAFLETVRESTAGLDAHFDNPALSEVSQQVEGDLRAGKTKIRHLANVKLELKNYTKNIAGVALSYVDESYYVSKGTNRQLSRPTQKNEKRALALREKAGQWKIYAIFNGLTKNAPGQKP